MLHIAFITPGSFSSAAALCKPEDLEPFSMHVECFSYQYREDLGILRSELSLYLTVYFIATIFAMPLVGKWISKYNINKVLSIAFLLVATAVAAMSFYTEPWQWWISGAVFGIAGSFIFARAHAHSDLQLV